MSDSEGGADADEGDEDLADQLVAGVAVAVVGAVVLSAVAGTGVTGELAVVGFLLVVPLVAVFNERLAGLLGGDPDPATEDPEAEALERLRARYASGEIGELEFERRVERLLETESVEDAETFLGAEDADGRDGTADPEPTVDGAAESGVEEA